MSQELKDLVADLREQVAFLQELGVDTIDARMSEAAPTQVSAAPASPVSAAPQVVPKAPVRELPPDELEISRPPATRPSAGKRLASLPSLAKRTPAPRRQGGETAPLTKSAPPAQESSSADTMFGEISGLPESNETMEQIWADIGNCIRCPLHEGRTQIVQTVGNYQSDLMFVGEAPGADEDAKGEPFVGRAGQLLNKIIEAIGMKREEVCIGNINRCRPPGNRQPTLPEAHTCRPFLLREIAVIRPKVIVVMGNTALHNLLDTKIGITRMRGQFHDYFGVKVMPTFHPAYLLRDPSKKREVWDDMKKVRDYLTSLAQ